MAELAIRSPIIAVRAFQNVLKSLQCLQCKHINSQRAYVTVSTSYTKDSNSVRVPINRKLLLRGLSSGSSGYRAPPGTDPLSEATPSSASPLSTSSSAEHIVKVKPVKKKAEPPQKYLSNVFITPLRAMREYLLTPSDLTDLWKTTRRSPYENSPPITVYLRHDVVKKAKEKYGTLENLEKEKAKARLQEDLYLRGLTSSRPLIFDYRDKYSETPKTDQHLEKERKTIFKSGSGKVVLTAIAINSVNAVVKCIAWLYTGSHAMFAEAIHSLADTMNQCILAYGIHHSLKNPNPDHPYGYTNFGYVSSLISGVGIFCVGAGFAWYHGIAGIAHQTNLVDLNWLSCSTQFGACVYFVGHYVTVWIFSLGVRHSANGNSEY
ncbi:hypothetical protein EB796_022009 [Bugula neritina]|uniref:Cation efflux protein transmembrane domain-containing protein n=1 Tax=Bugula neritina TaxID=10212 RepID=A0A7J7J1Y4_BUGNE|nr:hypothetical protein EB796_022009 [Bugula neritina]